MSMHNEDKHRHKNVPHYLKNVESKIKDKVVKDKQKIMHTHHHNIEREKITEIYVKEKPRHIQQ